MSWLWMFGSFMAPMIFLSLLLLADRLRQRAAAEPVRAANRTPVSKKTSHAA
jgi:hypothetical protein